MRKLAVFGFIVAGVVALATPAQAHDCRKDIHVHTGLGVAVCRDI